MIGRIRRNNSCRLHPRRRCRRSIRAAFRVLTVAWLMVLPVGFDLPGASASPCADVEVVFARGTGEAPGVGRVGQAFIDQLQSRIEAASMGVHPVEYPASYDFPTAAAGVVDAADHLQQLAATCPLAHIVLGGYSQGAAVIGYLTSAEVPAGYTLPSGLTGPLPAKIADRVSAVALFGVPTTRFLKLLNAPPIVIGPSFSAKTIMQCAENDPVCAPSGMSIGAHRQYEVHGMVEEAADFAAARLT